MDFEVNGCRVVVDDSQWENPHGPLTLLEAQAYVQRFKEANGKAPRMLVVKPIGEDVELEAHYEPMGFERIRRITGYLVGTVDRWCDAKKAEERDRVKHDAVGDAPAAREEQ